MNIDLSGRHAILFASDGAIAAALFTALADNGATVLRIEDPSAPGADALPAAPSLLVNVSPGAERIPDIDSDSGLEHDAFATLTRRLAPGLSRVVNVFSCAGLVPIRGLAHFSAAQAGLASLTRTLAMELGPRIAVNAVATGAYADAGTIVSGSRLLSHAALHRPATLAEITAAALFLADPDNGYMTGHTLAVDGGWAAGYARNF